MLIGMASGEKAKWECKRNKLKTGIFTNEIFKLIEALPVAEGAEEVVGPAPIRTA